jgi:hypothetical protein
MNTPHPLFLFIKKSKKPGSCQEIPSENQEKWENAAFSAAEHRSKRRGRVASDCVSL